MVAGRRVAGRGVPGVFAWAGHSIIGVFIIVLFVVFVVRRARTRDEGDRRWAEAFMENPKNQYPQRLEISEQSVQFHLGEVVRTWVWSEIVEVHESPLTFTFITPGDSKGSGAARVNAIISSVVILPRAALAEGDEPRLRELLQQKNKLMRDVERPRP